MERTVARTLTGSAEATKDLTLADPIDPAVQDDQADRR